MDEKADIIEKGLKRKYILTGSFILVLSVVSLLYIFFQFDEVFAPYYRIFLFLVLIIIPAGLIILLRIFNRVFSEAASLKEAAELVSKKSIELNAIKNIANIAVHNRDFEELLNAFLDK